MLHPIWLIMIGVYGACIGSFLNVVVYRLPEGLSLVRPPSRCPKCEHRLAWFENLPVVGWLWLRGRCRHCGTAISIQYPLVELLTGLLFASLAWFYFSSGWQPTWQRIGPEILWPVLLIQLTFISAMLASLIIDARYFIIPISIPWFSLLVSVAGLTVATWWYPDIAMVAPAHADVLLDGQAVSRVALMAFGGVIGLGIANGLIAIGIMPRSFPEDEYVQVDADGKPIPPASVAPKSNDSTSPAQASEAAPGRASRGNSAAGSGGQTSGGGKSASASGGGGAVNSLGQVVEKGWLEHPHPRREVLKELLFIGWPLAGVLGGLALSAGLSWHSPVLEVLGHSLLGALVGGGIVWLVRIAGTLVFGREAMGLGDVHLMLAVGAVLGWMDVLVAFFVAPFIALAFTIAMLGLRSVASLKVRQIPFGPHLAAASLLVMVIGGQRLLTSLGVLP
ncbi:MAG: prepilin peptidase [Phycisphaeraceae bacterium]|nr:prepilin peptidase [Phycisphaeraceae bacterium]